MRRNYITNFGDFIAPFPNYFNLASDVRYLLSNGVRGLFQEGSYCAPGGDFDELKDYLLGKIMFGAGQLSSSPSPPIIPTTTLTVSI